MKAMGYRLWRAGSCFSEPLPAAYPLPVFPLEPILINDKDICWDPREATF
jgi:hypothetical protein